MQPPRDQESRCDQNHDSGDGQVDEPMLRQLVKGESHLRCDGAQETTDSQKSENHEDQRHHDGKYTCDNDFCTYFHINPAFKANLPITKSSISQAMDNTLKKL